MKTKLVIELEGGCVRAVYSDADPDSTPEVYVVDLDLAQVGESTAAQRQMIYPLAEARDIISDSLLCKIGPNCSI